MNRSELWGALPLLLVVACGGGDAGIENQRSRAATGLDQPGFTAGASGAEQPPPSMGAFGNSSADPAANAPPPSDMPLEEECAVGERCGPMGPDPDDCGSLTLEAEVEVIEVPGNVLLVFDRSSSMAQDWNGQPRWQVAGGAIDNALKPLADKLTVGSVFFPSPDPNAPQVCIDPTGITCIFVPGLTLPAGTCDVSPISGADQINFAQGPQFLSTLTTGQPPLYAPVDGGFTPLKEGLQEAQAAIAGGSLTGITSVIVITDGEPNCEWDAAVARQVVADWANQGIKTYVIGLPGVGGNGPQVLNDLAATGGTGSYLTPDNASALEQELQNIVQQTVQQGFDSCEIKINPPAEVPDKLHLVVTEGGVDQSVARDLSDDAGWNVTPDGSLVTLEGLLCNDATDGRFEALRFEFGCVDLPPLPPPKPPE